MPQIGWLEILIIVIVSILVVGPKDFPVMLNKIGRWITSIKRYFMEVQSDVTSMNDKLKDELIFEEQDKKKIDNNNKK
jgi:sec-independent protein translocase protein TatB|tara:strand:+ start:97 stop:330 length:234 start_codon:yes stop_codon:yes gene_type:complete